MYIPATNPPSVPIMLMPKVIKRVCSVVCVCVCVCVCVWLRNPVLCFALLPCLLPPLFHH